MSLRIAFDLDGVLADMHSALRQQAGALFGPAPEMAPREDSAEVTDPAADDDAEAVAAPRLELTEREQRMLWRQVRRVENFWELLVEIEPGSVARLQRLASEREWEVLFLTKRPRTNGATSQIQSQRWLRAHGFEYPSVYVVNGSRGYIAASLALDVVVDDTPENCLDVATDSRATVVGVFRDLECVPPVVAKLGIKVVRSLDECFDLLTDIDARRRAKPGPLRRVLQTLGGRRAAGV